MIPATNHQRPQLARHADGISLKDVENTIEFQECAGGRNIPKKTNGNVLVVHGIL